MLTLEEEALYYDSRVENVTPEEVGRLVSRSWTGALTMASDDTDIFAMAKDAYGGTGNKQEIYLKTVSGSGYSSNRVESSKNYEFSFSALSLILMTQDDRFAAFLKKNPEFIYSGFIPRLCAVWCQPMSGYMKYHNVPMNAGAAEGWKAVVQRIKNAAIDHIDAGIAAQEKANMERSESEPPEPLEPVKYRVIKTSRDMESSWNDWVRARESKRRPGEENAAISSWASKSNNRALVFAALLTLADDPKAAHVSSPYVQVGIDIEEALNKHALYSSDATVEDKARQLKNILINIADTLQEEHGHEPDFEYGLVPARLFNEKTKSLYWVKQSMTVQKSGAVSAVDGYVQLLTDYGHIKVTSVSKGRGRPSKFYFLRPEGL